MFSCTGGALHIYRSVIHFLLYMNGAPREFYSAQPVNLYMAGLLNLVLLIYCELLCCLFILCSLCSFVLRNKPDISFILGTITFIFKYIYIGNKQNIIYVYVILFITII